MTDEVQEKSGITDQIQNKFVLNIDFQNIKTLLESILVSN